MSQAYIVECEFAEPGEQLWFPNILEAETNVSGGDCCVLKPVDEDYDGPKWVSE